MDWGNDSIWTANITSPSIWNGGLINDRVYCSSFNEEVYNKERIREYLKNNPEFLNELIIEQRKIKIEKIRKK